MSQNDWSVLAGSLTSDLVRSGPTVGAPAPNGGGTHVFGMRSVGATAGVVGRYCLQQNFSPTPANKGGRISGALRRASLGNTDGFAPFLFFCAQGSNVSDDAYLLGLSSENAAHIQLRKGAMIDGLAGVTSVLPATAPNVLMRSTNGFASDTWLHLRLDVIVQGSGDVILQTFYNDLTVNTVINPVWLPIPGMEGPNPTQVAGFVDDALGINTGSQPYTAGYMGYGARFETSNRAVFLDQIACDRQI